MWFSFIVQGKDYYPEGLLVVMVLVGGMMVLMLVEDGSGVGGGRALGAVALSCS